MLACVICRATHANPGRAALCVPCSANNDYSEYYPANYGEIIPQLAGVAATTIDGMLLDTRCGWLRAGRAWPRLVLPRAAKHSHCGCSPPLNLSPHSRLQQLWRHRGAAGSAWQAYFVHMVQAAARRAAIQRAERHVHGRRVCVRCARAPAIPSSPGDDVPRHPLALKPSWCMPLALRAQEQQRSCWQPPRSL